jgi:aryl-alcohol dehydrogenase-like predicted oxidoreductase
MIGMQRRRLGSTELSVSVVGVGTWQFAGVWGKQFEQREVDDILSAARALGINFLDTAECYGHQHLSESLIGNSLAGRRKEWIIATKFGHNPNNNLKDENYSPAQVLLQLEASLRALQTDYIDVYQLHSAANEFFDNDELWTMLGKQVDAGKIRYLGNSVPLPNASYQLPRSSAFGIRVIQVPYNALLTKAEETVLPEARKQDLGVIARTPLASGFLSGKYQPGHVFAKGDVRSWRQQDGVDRDIHRALTALQQRPAQMEPVAWANAWCLKQTAVSTVIPGIKSVEQLQANALAGDISL